jgi:hypothetical protein
MMSFPPTTRRLANPVFFAWLLMAVSALPAAAAPETPPGPPSDNGPLVVRAQF